MGGNALGKADLGRKRQRPDAGWLVEGTRTLVQQGAELLASCGIEDGRIGERARRAGRERGEAVGVEGVDGIANGLVVAAQCLGDSRGVLARGARQEDVAAAYRKAQG